MPDNTVDTPEASSVWTELPADVLVCVCQYFALNDWKNAQIVCRAWKNAIRQALLRLKLRVIQGQKLLDAVSGLQVLDLSEAVCGDWNCLPWTNLKHLIDLNLTVNDVHSREHQTLLTSLDDVGQLTTLQRLALSGQAAAAKDPDLQFMAGSTSLSQLTLVSDGNLSATGMMTIAVLPHLKHLHLGFKDADFSTAAFARLQQLHTLHLCGTWANLHPGVSVLCALPLLSELSLESDSVTSNTTAALAEMPALTLLRLENCTQLTDEGLHCLAALRSLRRLVIDRCEAVFGWGLSGLTQLEALSAAKCWELEYEALLLFLAQVPGLVALDLHEDSDASEDEYEEEMDDADVLLELPLLREVNIRGNTYQGGALLRKVLSVDGVQLESLEARHVRMDLDRVLGQLSGQSRLKRLSVAASGMVGDSTWEDLSNSSLDSLTHLDLRLLRDEPGDGMQVMTAVGACPALAHLTLSAVANVDMGIEALADLSALQSLALIQCSGMTSAAYSVICTMTGLTSLVFEGCEVGVGDEDLELMASSLSALQCLMLYDAERATDAGVAKLSQLRQLQRLALPGAGEAGLVSEACLEPLSRLLRLHALDISRIALTETSWQLLAGFPNLKELHGSNLVDAQPLAPPHVIVSTCRMI